MQINYKNSFESVKKETCTCPDVYINYWNYQSNYILGGTNLGLQYYEYTIPDTLCGFEIMFADTNITLHNSPAQNTGSTFKTIINGGNYPDEMDSLAINGKYYYHVINLSPSIISGYSKVTACKYSRGFGIVQFKYSGNTYSIVP